MKQNYEPKIPKKWVVQAIISMIIFSVMYTANQSTAETAEYINNFRKYALVHNTDFKQIFNNTITTMSAAVDLMFTADADIADVFSNTEVEDDNDMHRENNRE